VSAARLAWPGIALSITFVDDLVAGPILVAVGALIEGPAGVALGVVLFTVLVGALMASVILTGPVLEPAAQARVEHIVAKASRRRVVGPHVRRVGDQHPSSTALLAAAISPVFAVLLARVIHPSQTLEVVPGLVELEVAVPRPMPSLR
jgi:hypothetical protein